MTLAAGTKLGPYEILAPLGAGGMGEVYRARDTRLDRTVAIKVLSPRLALSPEALQRFEREARAISKLSHPNVCALYDVGRDGGTDYLVMEHLEGETLAQALARGALPLPQALRCAIEIAGALDAAHRHGVVHRDLKPGNVMMTKTGVKLLDFGLARTFERPLDAAGHEQAAAEQHPLARKGLTAISTVIGNLTQEGTLLGTLSYMAPEQLEGKDADARTDIFAFGAVVYEMATGQKAFTGKSHASLISAIMTGEPTPLTKLLPMTPPALDRIVRTCLAKGPEERWQSAGDLRRELRWVAEGRPGEGIPVTRGPRRPWLAWAVAALGVVAAVGLAVSRLRETLPSSRPVRFSFPPPEKAAVPSDVERHDLAVSPDGERIAFVVSSEGQSRIWVRSLDALSPRAIPGTEGASSPFWSPDGSNLAFFADGKLKRVALAGGPAQKICDAAGRNAGSWGKAGTILFTQYFSREDGLYAVAAAGGSPARISTSGPWRGFMEPRWPHFLPDGNRFLCLSWSPKEGTGFLLAGSVGSPALERIAPLESRVELSGGGHLLYVHEGLLVARPFDAAKLRFTGEAIPIAERLPYFGPTGWAPFSGSPSGVFAYLASGPEAPVRWFDREGRGAGTVGPPGAYGTLRLSPDGRSAALEKSNPATGTSDLWLADLSRDVLARLTSGRGLESYPVFSPDGRQIAFLSHGAERAALRRKLLADAGEGEALLGDRGSFPVPSDWSPDGRLLTYTDLDPKTGSDIWMLSMSGDRTPAPFRQTEFNEGFASFSPDGQWLAYLSDESGRAEVYAAPVQGSGPKWRVSRSGSRSETPPRWGRGGKELSYFSADGWLTAVAVDTRSGSFASGTHVALFRIEGEGWNAYDVGSDGERFLLTMGEEQSVPITVVSGWMPERGK